MCHAIRKHPGNAWHGDDKGNDAFVAISHGFHQFMKVLDATLRRRIGKVSYPIDFQRAPLDFDK